MVLERIPSAADSAKEARGRATRFSLDGLKTQVDAASIKEQGRQNVAAIRNQVDAVADALKADPDQFGTHGREIQKIVNGIRGAIANHYQKILKG